MQFTKMHGAGNDYVYVDCFANEPPANPAELSIAISDRNKGIGGDGLILIRPSDVADGRMQMFNADGSEAEMCGNGIRCVAKYLYDHKICQQNAMKIETGAGILALELEAENGKVRQVQVDMGEPVLLASEIPTTLSGNPEYDNNIVNVPISAGGHEFHVTCVSMGNPHCVIFVDHILDDMVNRIGPLIEKDSRFPARTNVEFIEVKSPSEVRQRTWERGSGETMACGTGASAVCVAGVLAGKTERKINNRLLGGVLTLEWKEDTNHVFMTGPAAEVFSGTWKGLS
jgi:diaminopimelate epimerase